MDLLLIEDENAEADIDFKDSEPLIDDGLGTAMLLSLRTDRRAKDDDLLPDERSTDRGGWWGDELDDEPLGSRLWLLSRSKATEETLRNAEEYAYEALEWLVLDGVAERLTVAAMKAQRSGNADPVLILQIIVKKPDDQDETFKFRLNWAPHEVN